jgi:hypothetical protein
LEQFADGMIIEDEHFEILDGSDPHFVIGMPDGYLISEALARADFSDLDEFSGSIDGCQRCLSMDDEREAVESLAWRLNRFPGTKVQDLRFFAFGFFDGRKKTGMFS